MPPSILRWAFHSPLRLALVAVTLTGVLVGVLVLVTTQSRHDVHAVARPAAARPVPASPVPSPPASTPTPTPTPSERTGTRARTRVVNVSRVFVDTWARHGRPTPRSTWLRRIERRTTPSLYRGLEVTDPARLPHGRAQRVDLAELGAFAATTNVTLTSGLQVEVRLVVENGRWLVADVRPVDT
jgi:hypothetical protein